MRKCYKYDLKTKELNDYETAVDLANELNISSSLVNVYIYKCLPYKNKYMFLDDVNIRYFKKKMGLI